MRRAQPRPPRPKNGPSARDGRSAAIPVVIRRARRADLPQIVAIDAAVTGLEKRAYWRSIFGRYANGKAERQFLVADAGGRIAGLVIGEIRDWEFGSAPCGWVFGIDVDPQFRQAGIGTRLLEAICASFRRAGISKVRTLLARDNKLVLSFFRSQGMMAGPFIPLEMDIDD